MFYFLLWIGCKSVPDAPKELDDLAAYLFEHFDEEDPAYMQSGIANLITWTENNREKLNEGYRIENLSVEVFEELGFGAEDMDKLLGAAVATDVHHSLDETIEVLFRTDPMAMNPDNYEFNIVDWADSMECFLAKECDFTEYDSHLKNYFPLGIEVETWVYGRYRWVESDRGKVAVLRRWLTKPAVVNFDWLNLDLEFAFSVYLPTEEGMMFVDMDWIIASLGDLPVPEDFMLSLAIDMMRDGRKGLETYMDEN